MLRCARNTGSLQSHLPQRLCCHKVVTASCNFITHITFAPSQSSKLVKSNRHRESGTDCAQVFRICLHWNISPMGKTPVSAAAKYPSAYHSAYQEGSQKNVGNQDPRAMDPLIPGDISTLPSCFNASFVLFNSASASRTLELLTFSSTYTLVVGRGAVCRDYVA